MKCPQITQSMGQSTCRTLDSSAGGSAEGHWMTGLSASKPKEEQWDSPFRGSAEIEKVLYNPGGSHPLFVRDRGLLRSEHISPK